MNDTEASGRTWINPALASGAGADRLGEALTRGSVLRRKVAAGWALGTFQIELPTPAVLGSLALAGFDFVVIDMEHSAIGFANLEGLITAGQAAGLATLVRTWGQEPGLIGKVLDMGANGIMAAHVDSAVRARQVVAEARFKPQGDRGFSPLSRFDALRTPLESLNESTYVIVQIEGRDALGRVPEIAAVPGIDAVFVGPYDLALSMGVPPGSAEVFAAAERMARDVPGALGLGIYVDDPARCAEWAARRFALQCVGFDGRMLSDGARSIADQARSGMAARGNTERKRGA